MKGMNRFQKLASIALVTLHISGIAVADVGTQNRIDNSRERDLLESLISLDGQKLSPQEYKTEALDRVASYENTTQGDQRLERLERLDQAIVDLKLMTPSQTESFKAQVADRVSKTVQAHPGMSESELQNLEIKATADVVSGRFEGAQFSGCGAMGIGAGAILAAAILGDVYAGTLTHTSSTSYSSGTSSNSTSTVKTSSGSSITTVTTSTYNGVTTVTTTTEHPTEKSMLYAGSGIAYGVAGVMFVYMLVQTDYGDICGSH